MKRWPDWLALRWTSPFTTPEGASISRAVAVSHLAENHIEYWKSYRHRSGEYTVGFEWFAPWPAVKRFRWYNPATWWPYLTTRGPSPLGWIATSAQCRRELTEESLAAKADREKRPANGVALLTMVLMMQAQKTRGNKRQGWTPDGQSLEAGA